MIHYENISAWYRGKKNKVIENSDFILRPGKVTALTGLNGSGKTTLIKSMLGLLPKSEAILTLDNTRKHAHSLNHFMRIGYAPEVSPNSSLFKVDELISLYQVLRSNWPAHNGQYSFGYIKERFNLAPLMDMNLNDLSKGMKKRVLISCAFLNNPQILILDEPFEGLDKNQRRNVKDLLRDFGAKKYVLISSHELLELKSFCDTYWVVENNRVREVERDEI